MFGRRIGYNEEQRKLKRANRVKGGFRGMARWFKRRGWIICLMVLLIGVGLWEARFYVQRINPIELRHLQIIEIEGNRMLSWEDVVQSAQLEPGMLMSEVNADSVKKALLQIPLIHSAEVDKHFPSSMFIKIQEASPVLTVLENGKGIVYSERGMVLPMSMTTAYHLPVLENESVEKVRTAASFLSAMRRMDAGLFERVSQIAWSEEHGALEVYFRDVDYKTLFPVENWNKDLFALYESLGEGFSPELRCAREVDMRFVGFAYVRSFDKRCVNG